VEVASSFRLVGTRVGIRLRLGVGFRFKRNLHSPLCCDDGNVFCWSRKKIVRYVFIAGAKGEIFGHGNLHFGIRRSLAREAFWVYVQTTATLIVLLVRKSMRKSFLDITSFSSNFTSVAKTGRFNVMIEQKCTSFIHLFISIILKNLLNSLSFARSL
jgi:hypothetical protein